MFFRITHPLGSPVTGLEASPGPVYVPVYDSIFSGEIPDMGSFPLSTETEGPIAGDTELWMALCSLPT